LGLREDAKKLFEELLGPQVASQLDNFDDPKRYPNDFLDECEHFLSELIGKDAAEKKINALREKYGKIAVKN
jgi:hypothetical protein